MQQISPIQRVKLHISAAEAIEKYIKKNEMNPGDKLPSERKLANSLSIGRSSLREALRQLETVNLVEVINGKGAYVKNPNNSIKGINVLVTNNEVDITEIFQVRWALESLAIELAIDNATDKEIEEMEKILTTVEEMVNEGLNPNDEDEEFHRLIYYASKNNMLINLLDSLSDFFDNLWHSAISDNSILIDSISLHRPLLQAIKRRKKEEAKKCFKKIIDFDLEILNNLKNEQ